MATTRRRQIDEAPYHHMHADDPRAVIGVDFGTAFSGFSFAEYRPGLKYVHAQCIHYRPHVTRISALCETMLTCVILPRGPTRGLDVVS